MQYRFRHTVEVFAVVWVSVLASTARSQSTSTQPPVTRPASATAESPPEPDGTTEGVIKAFEKLAADLQKDADLGEAITPGFVALKVETARRLREVKLQEARRRDDRAAELAALEAYVNDVRQTRQSLIQRKLSSSHPPLTEIYIAELALAEAKLHLSREKGSGSGGAATRAANAAEQSIAEPDGTTEGVIKAAEKLAADIQKWQELGGGVTPDFIALKGWTARRLFNARVEAARLRNDGSGELAAAQMLLENTRGTYRQLYLRVFKGSDEGGVYAPLLVATADLAEAKLHLNREKGRDPGGPATGPAHAAEQSVPEPDGTLEEVIKATEKLAANIQKRQDLGDALTPSFIALKGAIARRLSEARVEAARSRNDRAAELAAAEMLVENAQETYRRLYRLVSRMWDASTAPLLVAAADLAEAKLRMNQLKAAQSAAEAGPRTAIPAAGAIAADPKTDAAAAIEQLSTAEQGWRLAITTYEQNRQAFESVAAWASRVGESARDTTIPQDRRVAALKAFLDQARQLEKTADAAMKAGLSGQVDVVGAKYIRLQAERWLHEAEADK